MEKLIISRELQAKEVFASSFSRIWQRLNNNNIERSVGIITAFRKDLKLSENRKWNGALKACISNLGYGFFNVKGFYIQDHNTEEATPVEEDAIFVISGADNKLKKDLIKLGIKFEQDSILFKPFNSKDAILIGTNSAEFPGLGKEHTLGAWSPNKIDEFYSKSKGRAFVFASAEEELGWFGKWAKSLMEKRQKQTTTPEVQS